LNNESRDTKHKILDAAIDLFATRGYHESSMRSIASAVGIKAASLYSHFKSKESILAAILAEYKAELTKLRISDSRLAEIVQAYSPQTILVEGFKTIRKGVSGPRTEKIMRVLFNEMFKNPIVAEFGLDWLKRENLRELSRTFVLMQKRRAIKPMDPEFISLMYSALVNNYFQELFILKACGRDSSSLDQKTLNHFKALAELLSRS
jgi:TetR/AcrR family transcriptional regulator, biofilm operon repressor